MYKVIVPNGFDSIPLTLEDAMEYAMECNTDYTIVNLATGEIFEFEMDY